jgi:prepilin-type N-terminal cleavage/methylation domain-containing protein
MEMPHRTGFTLIELLVVVTIIAVLLALLTPALDKAVYQAELTVCGTRLKGIGVGVSTYALHNKRVYPHRPGVAGYAGYQPVYLKYDIYDDRRLLRPYTPINAVMPDPLCAGIDLENTTVAYVFAGYDLWFGWRYTVAGEKGMTRMGARFTWGTRSFNLLAGDYDIVNDGLTAYGSHPDRDGLMTNVKLQNQYSQWRATNAKPRGLIDMNFAYDDGSVRRLGGVATTPAADDRIFRLPYQSQGGSTATIGTHVPDP